MIKRIPWNKGKKGLQTAWNKGKKFIHSGSFKKGHKINVGRKFSKERNIKIGEANKGKPKSEAHRRKLSEANEGKTYEEIYGSKERAEEIKRKLSKIHKGQPAWNKGKKGVFSKITRLLWSKKRKGEKNPNWRGGIARLPYPYEFIKIKKIILKRDNYTCQECGKKGKEIHHIDYDKKNNNPKNLITLCKSCHSKTGFKRNDWIKHFQEKIHV